MAATVLITGVSGFIGSHVARAAKNKDWNVIGIDALEPTQATRADLSAFHRLFLGADSLTEILSKSSPDFCVHCAGGASVYDSFESPVKDFESGPRATFHLLDEMRRVVPSCRFVMLSSGAVYGNPAELPVRENQAVAPLSPYGWHKWLTERLCSEFVQLFGARISVARIFSAYGKGLRRQVVWDLCEKFAKGTEVVLQGDGTESRDFIHVNDIARGLLAIAERGEMNGSAYNLAAGEEVPIQLLAELIRAQLGLPGRMFRYSGTRPVGTPVRWQADITAVRNLGFEPEVAFANGLADYVTWWKTESPTLRSSSM